MVILLQMGRTALHVACRLEHVPLTKLILDMKDVNLDARMAVSQTPKHTTSATRCVLCTDCHNVCPHGGVVVCRVQRRLHCTLCRMLGTWNWCPCWWKLGLM